MTKTLPESVESAIAQCGAFLASGERKRALVALQSIPGEFLAHPLVLTATWEYYAQGKDWERALAVADILVAADLDSPQGWMLKTECHANLKQHDLLHESLSAAVSLFPNNAVLVGRLEAVRASLGAAFNIKETINPGLN